ncbi:uncharacterized protein LOC111086458 [Limulus polyphemus]|uniref:Uncharacterized protein LOC111086458 n=1 Tax=Limulus polyphemus TaxID=6850 RepID=A0ABM1SN89_LIMPO|nr:uncharacterized protein LOC111086458 [Limulus polyphemus]
MKQPLTCLTCIIFVTGVNLLTKTTSSNRLFSFPNSIYQSPRTININPYPGRFVGKGRVRQPRDGRDVELECNFAGLNVKLVSNVVWEKIEGPYFFVDASFPYHCPSCSVHYVNNYRCSVLNFRDGSFLHISDVSPEDIGIYRCSGTSQLSRSGLAETVYQIVECF